MRRSGMTLVELVVVLVILAVLTTIAVSMTDGVLDQSRFDATRTTLDNIQTAIVGPTTARDSTASFVSDMGGPPAGLGDLLTSTATPFTVVQQSLNKISSIPALTASVGSDLSNSPGTIYLGSGWRGPYLTVPSGALTTTGGTTTTVNDSWGQPFIFSSNLNKATTPTADATGSIVISSSGKPLTADAPTSPFNPGISTTIPATSVYARLSVSLANTNLQSMGPEFLLGGTTQLVTPQTTNIVVCCSSGTTTLAAQASGNLTTAGATGSSYTFTFQNVPCGNIAIFAYQVNKNTSGNTIGLTADKTNFPTTVSSIQYLRITGDTSKTIYLDLY
jgi:prepilin-type N-terminal cleavage/methylation domain-containing protein